MHTVPAALYWIPGQTPESPVQYESSSHGFSAFLQIVVLGLKSGSGHVDDDPVQYASFVQAVLSLHFVVDVRNIFICVLQHAPSVQSSPT